MSAAAPKSDVGDVTEKIEKISIDGKTRNVPPADALKDVIRKTMEYFSKPETMSHLRSVAKPLKGPPNPQLVQQEAIKLAGKLMEAYDIPSDHGFAVLRQVSTGKIYPEDKELRGLIQANAQKMTAV